MFIIMHTRIITITITITMSSDKSIVMKAFLNQFTDFVEDVHSVFPDNADIESAKTALFLVKKTNPRILMNAWVTYIVGPYTDEIEKGDIGFFLEKDYTQDLEYMGNAVMQKVDTLRGPVRDMGTENQAKSMKYIQNLTKLAKLHGEV
jgi:hypothetical protein